MALTKVTKDMKIIQALSDLPNASDGLSAAQLKAKFDEGGEALKTYLNDTLTVEIDSHVAKTGSYAEYGISTAQSIPTATFTQISWNTTIRADAANTELSGGSIKIKETGIYHIKYSISFSSSAITGSLAVGLKNGIDHKYLRPPNSTAETDYFVSLSANDTIGIGVTQNSGSAQNVLQDNRYTFLQVRRVG